MAIFFFPLSEGGGGLGFVSVRPLHWLLGSWRDTDGTLAVVYEGLHTVGFTVLYLVELWVALVSSCAMMVTLFNIHHTN